MTGFTRHHRPYPPMTDRAAPGEPGCHAESNDFACTRPYGHDGDHEAGGSAGQMFASWPAAEVTP